MDRQTVFPGAIPLETDLLNTNKYAMIGLAKLSAALMGSNTYFHGLACTPTSPASMSVQVAPGEIYSLQNIDGTAYSSLPADTTHSILKQGLLQDAATLTLTAPTTSGQSINYLIQVAYQDVDGGSTVLPYYNASNPTQAWSGPNNTGEPQSTVRSGACSVNYKAGVSATTGLQTTPPPDAGYIGAYVVTIANGQTTITSGNIALAANAPFIPSSGIVSGIQSGALVYAADTGTANSYVASYSPPITQLVDGVKVVFKAKTANTGASTFSANGLTNYPLYSHSQQALQGGEIVANGLVEAEWNNSLTAWVMCGNSGGAVAVPSATQSRHAVNLSQMNAATIGRLLNVRTITSTGTYTATAGTNFVIVYVKGAGGPGGSTSDTSSTTASAAGSGGEGALAVGKFTSGFNGQTVTIGAGGTPALGGTGTSGGTTSFGSLITAAGGNGAALALALVPPLYSSPGSGGIATTGGNIFSRSGDTGNIGQIFNPVTAFSGRGIAGEYGKGGNPVGNSTATSNPGNDATGYGSSGSGACTTGTGSTAALGGAGAPGICIVWEYS